MADGGLRFADLRDHLLANSPYIDSRWCRKDGDEHWRFGATFGLSYHN